MDKGDGHNVMEVDPQPGTSRGQKKRVEDSDSDVSTPKFQYPCDKGMDSESETDSLAGGYRPPFSREVYIKWLCQLFRSRVDVIFDGECIENTAETAENVGILVDPGRQPIAGGSMEGHSSTEEQGETMEYVQNDVLRKDQDVDDDADDEADGDDNEKYYRKRMKYY